MAEQRLRTRNSIFSGTTQGTWTRILGGPGSSTGTVVTLSSGEAAYIVDEIGPEFSRAKARGEFLVRNLEHVKVRHENGHRFNGSEDWWIDESNPSNSVIDSYSVADEEAYTPFYLFPDKGLFRCARREGVTWEDAAPLPFVDPLGYTFRSNQVLGKAYGNAASADWQSLVSMAEASKTLESVKRLTNMLPRFKQWLKRNRKALLTKKGLLRATGNLASQWLEYRYGFMQLYYDYQSFVSLMDRPTGKYAICRSSWEDTKSSYTDDIISSSVLCKGHKILEVTRTDIIRAGVIVRVQPYGDIVRGTGLAQPLSTMWELVPLSFILDWFIGVGDALSALDGRMFMSTHGSWLSHRCKIHARYRYYEENLITIASAYTRWEGHRKTDLNTVEIGERFVRHANPAYYFSFPDIRLRMNWKRGADLASMLRNLKHNALR